MKILLGIFLIKSKAR